MSDMTPDIVNFIIADRIVHESDGRYGAVGIFSGLTLRNREPSTGKRRYGPPWGILVELAGVKYDREYAVRLAVAKGDNSEPTAYAVEGKLTASPAYGGGKEGSSGFLRFDIPPFVTYSEGIYVIDLTIDDRLLKRKNLEVKYE